MFLNMLRGSIRPYIVLVVLWCGLGAPRYALAAVIKPDSSSVLTDQHSTSDENFDCSYAYLDKCGRDLFLWRTDLNDTKAPLTEQELHDHCQLQDAAEKCVRRRGDTCLSGLARGMSKLLLEAIRDDFEPRCDPATPEHATYLRLAPCLNELSDEFRECSIQFIMSTESASSDSVGKSFRQKVPRACCNFATYTDCMYSSAHKCGADGERFMQNMVGKMADDIVTLGCSESYQTNSTACAEFRHKGSSKTEAQRLDREAYDGDYKGIRTFISALAILAESLTSR